MKYFKKFHNISEKQQFIEKGSLIDIAWNILTLGQGNKILRSIKNVFSLSSYLIRAKHIKLRRILEKTARDFDIEYKNNKDTVLKSKDLIAKQIAEFVGSESETITKIKEILLNYELENRISGFDEGTKNMLENIKAEILKLKSKPENADLILTDITQMTQQLNKKIVELRAKKRTAMLPAHLIKNLALDVAKIINKNDNKDKSNLKIVWEKGKNRIFQDFNKLYDVSAIDGWLSLNNYKVQKYDPKLDALFQKLPKTIETLSQTFEEDSFEVVTKKTIMSFEPHTEYAFKINNYYLLVWCEKILDDDTIVLVSIGTYKFRKKDDNYEYHLYNSADIKYNNINNDLHIFYYVPNLRSYMIEENPSSSGNMFLSAHELSGDGARMDEEFMISVGQNEDRELVEKRIANLLWYVDNMQKAILKPAQADKIPNVQENVSKFQELNLDTQKRWSEISLRTLTKLGWNSKMSNREASSTLLQYIVE